MGFPPNLQSRRFSLSRSRLRHPPAARARCYFPLRDCLWQSLRRYWGSHPPVTPGAMRTRRARLRLGVLSPSPVTLVAMRNQGAGLTKCPAKSSKDLSWHLHHTSPDPRPHSRGSEPSDLTHSGPRLSHSSAKLSRWGVGWSTLRIGDPSDTYSPKVVSHTGKATHSLRW